MLAPGLAQSLGAIIIGAAIFSIRMIIRWLDRGLTDPVMRERINKGSEQFFAAEERRVEELEIDGGQRIEFRIPKSLAPPKDRR